MYSRKVVVSLLMCLLPMLLIAAPGWQGGAGKAPQPPEISETMTDHGKTILVKAVSDGPYQGASLNTAYNVSLHDGMKLSFDLRQAVRSKGIAFAIVLKYTNGRSVIRHDSSAGPEQWAHLELAVSKDGEFKEDKMASIPEGEINIISIYPFGTMDKEGQTYEIANFKILDADGMDVDLTKEPMRRKPEELDATYIKAEYWRGDQGQARIAPKITIEDTPYGKAVFTKAQEKGNYQGFTIAFPQPVDLEDIGYINFDFFQNIRPNMPSDIAVIIKYENPRNGLTTNVKVGQSAWNRVSIPIDLRTLNALARQSSPILGKVHSIKFSMYSTMNSPGHSMGIANLKFVKKTGIAPIRVSSYRYIGKPTSGDATRQILTDGEIVKADQAYYRVYADDPEIVFDLGAVYLVKSIEVSAIAVPSQNINDITVSTGYNSDNFRTAAFIANTNKEATETAYTISDRNLSIVGRYFKLRMSRSRTDFPVHIAEVAFTGKIPTDEEIASVADADYTVGQKMPAISPNDYVFLKGHDGLEMAFSKKNGVGIQLRQDKELLLERIFNCYELLGEKAKLLGKADGYSDNVISIHETDGGVEIVTRNPDLPNMEFTSFYTFAHGNISRKLTIRCNGTAKYIFHSALTAVLPKAMRDGGLYESWGSGHDMQHRFASEIMFDYPADTASTVVFESPRNNKCFLAFRYRYNDRYIQIGSGTITVSGFGEKRTVFTSNGWTVSDGIFAFNEKCVQGSVESMISCVDGDLTVAFDKYIALPEVKKFRSGIKRADWLRDMRLICAQGWIGLYGDTGLRIAKHHASLIREGCIQYGANDSNYHWGDFPVSGMVKNEFGGTMRAEEMRQRSLDIHKEVPNAKISQYTWLWSCSPKSKPFREHPEWFSIYNAQGQRTNFFPGRGVNFYRLVGIPESRDEIINSISNYISYYDNDVWYLDGGGSPAAVDWHNMRIDEPDAYDQLYMKIRERIQKEHPERAIFFNNPENPIGDMGYLESFGGVMTTNWRDGATWMYKFKLWQRPDPVFSPLYIYWLPGVDNAFRQYAAGTGLNLTFGGSYDRRRDVGIMQVQHQSRFARLVSADIQPNWRFDASAKLELMPLTFGKSGWLFVKNHDTKEYVGPTQVALAPLGVNDSTLPVHKWCFTLINHNDHKGLLGEKELEENYRNLRWTSDFIITGSYNGHMPWSAVARQDVSVAPEQMKLLYYTQSPAIVYSVDALRMQLLLDSTLGVSVSGKITGDEAAIAVDSTRNEAEIACVVPKGMIALQAKVNGKTVSTEMVSDAGTRLALVPVEKGHCNVRIAFAPAPAAVEKCTLAIIPGKTISAKWDKAGAAALAIYDAMTLVRNLPLDGKIQQADIVVPTGVTGNAYRAKLIAANGDVLAETSFKLDAGRPKIDLFRGAPVGKMDFAQKQFDRPLTPVPGIRILSAYTDFQPSNGIAMVSPENATIEMQTHPMYESLWNALYAGLELEAKRYVKVRITGNFKDYEHGPKSGQRGLSSKYDNADSAIGIMFDFADASGAYTTRVLASVGLAQPNRATRQPASFGVSKVPDAIGVISNYGLEYRDEDVFWIDLNTIGAPDSWNGKVMVSEIYNNITPNLRLQVQILESNDTLPLGETARKFYWLKGGRDTTEIRKFKLPSTSSGIKLDGIIDDKEWKNALHLTEFSRTGNPTMMAPPTVMMLLMDRENIYIAAELTEPKKDGFTLEKTGKPWFNDGIEIYLQSQDTKPAYVQHIIAGANIGYAQWVAEVGVGKTHREITLAEYKNRLEVNKLYTEAKIPLKDLGSVKSGRIRFNLARNRMVNGNLEAYTFVPGKLYLNFDGAELEF